MPRCPRNRLRLKGDVGMAWTLAISALNALVAAFLGRVLNWRRPGLLPCVSRAGLMAREGDRLRCASGEYDYRMRLLRQREDVHGVAAARRVRLGSQAHTEGRDRAATSR